MTSIGLGKNPPWLVAPDDELPENRPHKTRLRPIHIVQIDNFNPILPEEAFYPQDVHFNHGETVANMLRAGGSDPGLKERIVLRSFNVGLPESQAPGQTDRWTAGIAEVLDWVIAEARNNPDAVDVVCMALQNPYETCHTEMIRQQIKTLAELGVPVVVAAGNRSDDLFDPLNFLPNALAGQSAFIAQATQHGNLLPGSKPGNVSAEARSTSFAAPAIATVLGAYKSQGFGMDEIRQLIQEKIAYHNGTLPAAIAPNAYSTSATVPQGAVNSNSQALQAA